MSNVQGQKKVVEQLRMEAALRRKPVSDCIKDLINFIDQNREQDHLVIGFAIKKDNPFMEKGGCSVI